MRKNLPRYPLIDAVKTGGNIKKYRIDKGFTIEDISRYCGLNSNRAVLYWQDGTNLPSLENLYALSLLFQVPMNDLIVPAEPLQKNKGGVKASQKSHTNYEFHIYEAGVPFSVTEFLIAKKIMFRIKMRLFLKRITRGVDDVNLEVHNQFLYGDEKAGDD